MFALAYFADDFISEPIEIKARTVKQSFIVILCESTDCLSCPNATQMLTYKL